MIKVVQHFLNADNAYVLRKEPYFECLLNKTISSMKYTLSTLTKSHETLAIKATYYTRNCQRLRKDPVHVGWIHYRNSIA